MQLTKLAPVLLFSASACTVSPPEPTKAFSEGEGAELERVQWARYVACGERSDAVGGHFEQEAKTSRIVVSGWQSHYNRQTHRCYVLIERFDTQGKGSADAPISYAELFDAFERRRIASFTSHRLSELGEGMWCSRTSEDDKRETSSASCEDVKKFVDELMRD